MVGLFRYQFASVRVGGWVVEERFDALQMAVCMAVGLVRVAWVFLSWWILWTVTNYEFLYLL